MKLRILVTGKNRRIAKDICDHLQEDRGYEPLKCTASKRALLDTVLTQTPHIIIICLGNETPDSVKLFNVLCDSTGGTSFKIFVVANDEDRKTFINETEIEKIFLLSRPVSLVSLYMKLEELEEYFETHALENTPMLTEYVNEKAMRRKHILVVDDDSEQLAMIRDHLREFYDVTLTNGGRQALKYLEKHETDLVLLDYMMPEMDGPEMLKVMRTYPNLKDIPVIFLTGLADRDRVINMLVELKPQGYILKPAKKSELVARIIDVLG